MSESRKRAGDIASELLAQAQMAAADVAERRRLAEDRAYWLTLAPHLSIGNPPRAQSPVVPEATLDAVRRHFAREGYFQMPPVLSETDLARLNGAIDTVVAAGWPPVFAWVYDEFWALARLPDVLEIVATALGAGCSQIPHIWTHVVPAMVGSSGWTPHFDGTVGGRASVWIALTDATLANGCMHVVSRRHVAASFMTETLESGRVALAEAFAALQGVRALPAPRGSALGWTFDVLHWGGACLSPDSARRAISMEFMSAGQRPDPDESPLLSLAGDFPTLADRLRMIGIAIVTYQKFEPGLVRYRALAKALRG